ncbi:MAG: FAD-dependent oxidoreductase [Chloroflexi bacterium]|nr:FAD-dependent oxidoreductase [Chloroflexota bacterium]MCI0574853.1 FAD-dependent oxidoreductase [Chloroflexota bacterium]MCI0645929.1 FAD-dependent oxidoreductase [Chloroflexota bacterium]MCI0726902.1 FAD-dependent oxidoreductase [Chloroflexota bacterium]
MATIDCLDILKNGLPAAGLPPRHIVIVGAGIAGLAAGLILKEAGHEVTILEAQNRLGGRIYTYRGFPGKMYGEFGAMRFPRRHKLAQYLIQERFKLETRPFPMYDADTFIYLDGKAMRRTEFHPDRFHFELLPSEVGKLPDRILRDAVQPLIEIIEQENGWEQLLNQYDKHSLIDYLMERGVSHGALAMMGPLLNLEGRYHFSLLEWFFHYYDDVFGDLLYIVDGADSLPNAFAPHLMNDVRLGAEVHAIEQTPGKVIVHFRDRPGTSQSMVADECILTVPFSLLRHMEIQGLDSQKWYGIRNVYYDRAHKIFMQFSERWWQTKYQITHGVTATDLAIRSVVYTPAGQDDRFQKGVLIASYAWGQDSMAYSMLTEEQRISQALQDLVKIHPEARHTFEFGISHDWALDQYAGGIGPLFRPHEMSGHFYDNIIRPVGRLWFANDACDRRHRRWIEAALTAAVKNAYALHTGLRNELPQEIE